MEAGVPENRHLNDSRKYFSREQEGSNPALERNRDEGEC